MPGFGCGCSRSVCTAVEVTSDTPPHALHAGDEQPAIVVADQLDALFALLALPALSKLGHQLEADVIADVDQRPVAFDANVAVSPEAQPAQRTKAGIEDLLQAGETIVVRRAGRA